MALKELALGWSSPSWPTCHLLPHLRIFNHLVFSAPALFLLQNCNCIFLSAILQERRMVLTSYELSHPSFLTQPNDSFCFFFNTWVNLKSLPRFIFWSEVEEALQDSQRRKIKHGVSQQDYGIVNLHSINKKHKMAIWRDTDIYFWKRSQLCVQSISENL